MRPDARPVVIAPRSVTPARGPQSQQFLPMVTDETCGATDFSMALVRMAPGQWSRPHVHRHSDIVVVVVEGWAASLVGPELRPIVHGPGDFCFIPRETEHAAANLSRSSRLVAIETRTDPRLNEDVCLLPDLEPLTRTRAADAQVAFVDESGSPAVFVLDDDAAPTPTICGTWEVYAPDAPFAWHLMTFVPGGSMLQSNPHDGDRLASDSAGHGIWRVTGDTTDVRFVEHRADRTSGEYLGRTTVRMDLAVTGDDFVGTATTHVLGVSADDALDSPATTPVRGRRLTFQTP